MVSIGACARAAQIKMQACERHCDRGAVPKILAVLRSLQVATGPPGPFSLDSERDACVCENAPGGRVPPLCATIFRGKWPAEFPCDAQDIISRFAIGSPIHGVVEDAGAGEAVVVALLVDGEVEAVVLVAVPLDVTVVEGHVHPFLMIAHGAVFQGVEEGH